MYRKTLFIKLSEYHGENVLILSSPGFVNAMGFRSELAQSLHLVKNTDDDVEYCVDIVASAVTNECLDLKINIEKELVRESVGFDTANISTNFDKERCWLTLFDRDIVKHCIYDNCDAEIFIVTQLEAMFPLSCYGHGTGSFT